MWVASHRHFSALLFLLPVAALSAQLHDKVPVGPKDPIPSSAFGRQSQEEADYLWQMAQKKLKAGKQGDMEAALPLLNRFVERYPAHSGYYDALLERAILLSSKDPRREADLRTLSLKHPQKQKGFEAKIMLFKTLVDLDKETHARIILEELETVRRELKDRLLLLFAMEKSEYWLSKKILKPAELELAFIEDEQKNPEKFDARSRGRYDRLKWMLESRRCDQRFPSPIFEKTEDAVLLGWAQDYGGCEIQAVRSSPNLFRSGATAERDLANLQFSVTWKKFGALLDAPEVKSSIRQNELKESFTRLKLQFKSDLTALLKDRGTDTQVPF